MQSIRKNQIKLLGKIILREMKSPLMPITVISRIDMTKWRTSVLEDRPIKITQTEKRGERKGERGTKQSIQDLCDNIKSLTYV